MAEPRDTHSILRDEQEARHRHERESASKALLASEELNRRMMEAMPGGVVHVSSEGAVLAANPEALRVLGLSYDALTRKYTTDFDTETLHEDGSSCPATDYPVTRALTTGQPQPPMTIGVRQPNGSISWAVFTAVPVLDSSTSKVTSVVVTFLDITERRRAETALRESEARLRSIFESAPNPIAMTDREGIIRFVNRTGPGLDPATVTGLPAWHYLRVEDQDIARNALRSVVETGQVAHCEVMGRSGRRYSTFFGPMRSADGISGVAIISLDVTELTQLQTRLAIADRMASLGTLAAGVAHEINNPLTYVLANLSFLQRRVAATQNAEAQSWISSALEGTHRIRTIVHDLLSFSHVNEGRRVPLDVRHLLDSSISMAASEIRCRARVVKSYGEVPPIVVNDSRLGQVFLNLVVNAAQAIPEGDQEHNEIRVTTFEDSSGDVVVEFSDSGAGIPAEMIDRIFDPFMTTKPAGVGTGLGLYICRCIIDSLGGDLTVKSTPGVGSTFRVRIPCGDVIASAPDPTPPPPSFAPSPSPSPVRWSILVVDDEPLIVEVLKAFLSSHEILTASTGREAIQALDSRHFDLVFCDLVMPDLTGVDVYHHVQRTYPGHESRIVFMTGGTFTDRVRTFLDSVPNALLEKPFLRETVEDILRTRTSLSAARSP